MEELLNVLVLGEFSDDDVEDAILMHLLTTGENRHVDKRYGRLDFDNLTEEESFDLFRFGKEDIKQLTNLLGIDNVKTDVRCNLTGLESMCILLRRLAYPNRLVDLERVFGRSRSTISSVCNTLLLSLYQHVRPSLVDLRNVPWLTRERLQLYSDAISEKGAPLPDCWGFLDGTARAICRPKVNQREYFSGHKRAHCLKYQSVMCPDGIIVHLGGPYAGRRHDSGMLHESGFYGQLEEKTIFPDKSFVLYADQGYPLRELVITPYHRIMDDRQKLFNELMSSVRECVEWGFGKVANEFAFVDFHKNQKIGWQLVPEQYFIAVFLANCHTCLYGSITGQYFNLSPPSLEEYIAGVLKNKL